MKSACLVILMLMLTPHGVTAAANDVLIPKGTFQMGCSRNDNRCGMDEGRSSGTTVVVPAFSIDRYEVTVADYTRCIKQGACTRPKDYARNKYCNTGAKGRGNYPVNCVDWPQARDYCGWVGKRLPSEAEWEKAARGGTKTRYPWGESVTCNQAILDDKQTIGSVPDEGDGCGEDRTWPVGSRPANPVGLYDMHGNVSEWVANWYQRNAITHVYARGDLTGPAQGKQRVVRGGSWDEDPQNLRSSYRNTKPPVSGDSVYGSIGFRCARDAR